MRSVLQGGGSGGSGIDGLIKGIIDAINAGTFTLTMNQSSSAATVPAQDGYVLIKASKNNGSTGYGLFRYTCNGSSAPVIVETLASKLTSNRYVSWTPKGGYFNRAPYFSAQFVESDGYETNADGYGVFAFVE